MKIYSIYDKKSITFAPPFFVPTLTHALRSFDQLVNDSQSMVNRYPDDFALYDMGSFDDSNGKFDLYDVSVRICDAIEYVKKS